MEVLLKSKVGPVMISGLPSRVKHGNSIDGWKDYALKWRVTPYENGTCFSLSAREHPSGIEHHHLFVSVGDAALENAEQTKERVSLTAEERFEEFIQTEEYLKQE